MLYRRQRVLLLRIRPTRYSDDFYYMYVYRLYINLCLLEHNYRLSICTYTVSEKRVENG